ncbi:hypothetical protein BpHYR1_041048 [Brachionus plicatilis]|uniref:Uncharacterized protein n=1 Tax=Brachionus plicatilis TaxID=10195 RepID=A0A3M7PHF5_BRAPC|nr:hypothetical protein BpHYR1_041048 [Brachionus plicatilis]
MVNGGKIQKKLVKNFLVSLTVTKRAPVAKNDLIIEGPNPEYNLRRPSVSKMCFMPPRTLFLAIGPFGSICTRDFITSVGKILTQNETPPMPPHKAVFIIPMSSFDFPPEANRERVNS